MFLGSVFLSLVSIILLLKLTKITPKTKNQITNVLFCNSIVYVFSCESS